jgi:glycosyltransferase involved in cell wall biosynthesis
MRIMFLGNAPWTNSGYAEQIALLIPRLQVLGHELAVSANYGLQVTIAPWSGVPVYPSSGNWNNDSIAHHAEHFGADIVICLHDAWVMKPDAWPDDFRMAIWAPVDHWPIPPPVLGVLQHEKVQPIAMSKFGHEWMTKMKLDALYAPHAVDTKVFHPMPEVRDAVRDGMGIPRDAFLIGMVGANRGWNPHVSRKAFPQSLQAFAEFLPSYPDAWLYMHTEAKPSERGTALEPLIMALNAAQPGFIDRVRFPSDREMLMGLTREQLAQQYAAFDVLLNPSMSEGFGVPVLEAQACGVPVICSDHSAMSELTQAGWLVSGEPWWDSLQTSFAFYPHVSSIVAALERAYEERENQALRDGAAAFGRTYDANYVVAEHWLPIIERLASREVPPLNGKLRKKERKRAAAERRKVAT